MAERGLTKTANLLLRLRKSLPAGASEALELVLRLAEEEGRTLYLVGGGVRDLVLRRGQVDIDLVGEGPVAALGRKAALVLAGRCVEHRAFGTATVEGEGFRLDLAMARAESFSISCSRRISAHRETFMSVLRAAGRPGSVGGGCRPYSSVQRCPCGGAVPEGTAPA
jgi:hypothetical protein